MESEESMRVIPEVKRSLEQKRSASQRFIVHTVRNDALNTGKRTICEFDIDVPLGPFFARAVTAMRAIDDAVSKPEIIH